MKNLQNVNVLDNESLKHVKGGLARVLIFPPNRPEGIEIQVADEAVSALEAHVDGIVVG